MSPRPRSRRRVAFACASGVLAAGTAAAPQGEDAAPRETFALHPDLRIELFAGSATVPDPVAIAWSAAGVPWVLSAGERLFVLAGTDPDGRVEASVAADGLSGATSLLPHRGGVLVAEAAGVVWLLDRDGDGRLEDRSRVLACEGGPTSLRWGLDGSVYAACAEGVVRFDPAAEAPSAHEVVVAAAGVRSVDVTWDGELLFATDAAHLCHVVMSDLDFTAGRMGAVASWVDAADHSYVARLNGAEGDAAPSVGTCVLEGPSWPPELAGGRLACEPAGGLVHRDALDRSAVRIRARRSRAAELLASTDPSFRPVATSVGPGGALYVLERPAPDVETADPGGRIWRVVPRAAVLDDEPTPLDAASTAELTRALVSPDAWRRWTAHRLLRERGVDASTTAALTRLAREWTEPFGKVHALWLAPGRGELVRELASDYSPAVRRNALAVFRAYEPARRKLSAPAVRERTRDADARTRLAALLAWQEIADAGGHDELLVLYDGLQDDWMRSAVLAVAGRQPARFLGAALRRARGRSAAENGPLGDLLEALARDVNRRRASGGDGDAVAMVLELAWGADSPRLVERVLRAILEGPSSEPPWPSPRLAASLRRLADAEDLRLASLGLSLAHRWMQDQLATREVAGWAARLQRVAVDPGRSLELRLACMRTVLDLPQSQEAALEALAELQERPPWAQLVLDAVEDGTLAPEELDGAWRTRLREHPTDEVAARAAELLAER